MILLDTDVLSALIRRPPDRKVSEWLDLQPRSSIWTNSVTVMEIRYGILSLPHGRRRDLLGEAFTILMRDQLEWRIAPFDTAAAEHAAELMASRRLKGRPVEIRDTMIAGIAMAAGYTLASGNVGHFEGLAVPVVNPWAL